VPLGVGIDTAPSPNQSAPASGTDAPATGVPWPFLLIGLLLIAGAAGALIYSLQPRGGTAPALRHRVKTPDVLFTPYGATAPDPAASGPPPSGGAISFRRRRPKA
jgi:hypothetical protein